MYIPEQKLNIAIVVQRYGEGVIGGAESLARQYAERLTNLSGVQVTVLTTTAQEYTTWKHVFPAGTTTLNNVTIIRFTSMIPRLPWLFNAVNRLAAKILPRLAAIKGGDWLGTWLEKLWYFLQGPVAPELLQYIRTNLDQYDAFLFFTYLYAPTAHGLPLAANKSILVPTLHDEPPAFFATTRRLLTQARMILANTTAEMTLLTTVVPSTSPKIQLAGVGIDRVTNAATIAWPQGVATGNRYILYLGRLTRGKNIDELIRWFLDYRQADPTQTLKLVLAGKCDEDLDLPANSAIRYLGYIDDQEKQRLLAHALCIVNPSRYESLSLIVLEAMALKRPALVNGHCAVLNDYARQTKTVFAYTDQQSFSTMLAKITQPNWQAAASTNTDLDETLQWVLTQYSWTAILEKILGAVRQLKAQDKR